VREFELEGCESGLKRDLETASHDQTGKQRVMTRLEEQ
jgi:hypothetical protein